MLMTPMTPNVMASPIAASSSTEPSERPYQVFCSAVHSARLFWIDAIASAAACFTAGGRVRRQAAEQRERVLVAALADHRDGLELVGLGRAVEIEHDGGARLDQRLLDAGVVLLGDAPRRAPASAFGSRDLNTACAASRRLAGSGDISVRLPSAAATSPRSRLLSRTGARSAGGAPVTGWPVAASNSLSDASL